MVASALFGPDLPAGFLYVDDFITVDEEQELLARFRDMEFSRVEMRGVVAKRRTAHYGWTYGYEARRSEPGVPVPEFLLPLRERAAGWVGVDSEALAEALVTEYPEGAPIGWHRDAPMFDMIVGISLGAPCRMKLRPYVSPKETARMGREPRRSTHELELARRSAYWMTGAARRDFEHSIPPVAERRYSVTFRTLRR